MTGPILITGASGQVGSELLKLFPGARTPARAQLDLGSPESIREYIRYLKPCLIINPAAYTAVDRAESEPELAHAINGEAPRILGEEALRCGAGVIHFSTDYVFSGAGTAPYNEESPTAPLSVYGATKLAGERALAATGAPHIILRTSWVYGATGKNFLLTILRLVRERPQLKIVDDQHGAPTWSRDLALLTAHIVALCEADPGGFRHFTGIYHAASSGEATWFGFAQEALRHSAPTTAELVPIPSGEYSTPAPRPLNSRLDCSKLKRVFGYRMPDWQGSLAHVLAEIPK